MNEEQFLQSDDEVVSTGRQLSRRDFLKISGSGVFIFFTTGTLGAIALQQRSSGYPTDFNAYLKIGDEFLEPLTELEQMKEAINSL